MVTRIERCLPKYMSCGIIGYVRLGHGIAKYLFGQNIKPLVFDVDSVKMVEAYKDGCVPANKSNLLKSCDLIFCATGSGSISLSEFSILKRGCYVASVTSSEDEFDLLGLQNKFAETALNRYVTRLENSNTYFHMLNKGDAVNFLGGDRVGDFIRLVQAEILAGLHFIAMSDCSAGISEVSERTRTEIADQFLSKYLRV